MAKPTELTSVSAVPFIFGAAFCATRVENKGESAITTRPQKIRKVRKAGNEKDMVKGRSKQQTPEDASAITAIFFAP